MVTPSGIWWRFLLSSLIFELHINLYFRMFWYLKLVSNFKIFHSSYFVIPFNYYSEWWSMCYLHQLLHSLNEKKCLNVKKLMAGFFTYLQIGVTEGWKAYFNIKPKVRSIQISVYYYFWIEISGLFDPNNLL